MLQSELLDERVVSRLLKPADAADFLTISQRTLWTMSQRGQIPVIRLGRSVRYDRRDLEACLESCKTGGGR